MKISLRWLRRHVALDDLEPAAILDDLTMSTAEVEGLHEIGGGLDDVIVGHVVECGRHPDADKLSLTRVDAGGGELVQIVCGAPNVAKGQKVAVALPGATLPDGLRIKKTRIRGVESSGMICSERELQLSDDHQGILVLAADASVGGRLRQAMPELHDWVLEIDNKSINHRPDLWGHRGIARELAAIHRRPLLPLGERPALPRAGTTLPIEVADQSACPRYCGLCIDGLAVAPSPAWLQRLLRAVGLRPISNLVDLTNFVMLDLGQPMHAFDRRRLGARVGVRFAREGERMTTLDGVERRLLTSDLLITSDDAPVALAGVMGGEGTMVEDDTSQLFLESATFHPAVVRRTGVRLGLRTDASARFEKSLDPALAEDGILHFLRLMAEIGAPGAAAGPVVDPTGWSYRPRTVRLRKARLDLKLGVALPGGRVTDILHALAFTTAAVPGSDGDLDVAVPSFRATKDIAIEDDLIEEVGRMHRYANIPPQPLVAQLAVPHREPDLWLARELVKLATLELHCAEVFNYSFVADQVVAACGAAGHDYVRVANPVAPELARIRRHVLPSLLQAMAPNLRHEPEVRMVELGKGYQPEQRDERGLPAERFELALAFARTGAAAAPCAGELREGVRVLLDRTGFGRATVHDRLAATADCPWAHPGRTAAVELDGAAVGYVGTLHPRVAAALELPANTAVAALDLRALLAGGRSERRMRPIPRYPSQPVDVALVVAESARVAEVEAFLRQAGRKAVRDVVLFEVYRGSSVPAGHKSLNFTVVLGADDRTLTADDEARYLARVRAGCGEIGAELRG